MPAKEPRPASHFKLTLGGKESAGVFREISGLDNESDIVEHKYVDEQGKQAIRKVVGATKWSNLALKRGVDENLTLWKWRQQVIDGDVDGARTDGDWRPSRNVSSSSITTEGCCGGVFRFQS